jgi:hypothetical protein
MAKRSNVHVATSYNKGERGILRRAIRCKINKLKAKPATKATRQAVAYCNSILRKLGDVCKCCGRVIDR